MENIETKYEWVELPSKGQCYPIDSPLREGRIKMEYLTAMDENILINLNNKSDEEITDLIIKRKIVDKNIDISKLVKGDRDAILLWLRRTGFGDDFNATLKNINDENEKDINTTINLSEIKYNEFSLIGDKNGYFMYFMNNGDILKFRYPSYKEMEEFVEKIISSDNNGKISNLVLNEITVSINNSKNKKNIEKYIKKMNYEEQYSYKEYVQNHTPSVNNIIDVNITQNDNVIEKQKVFVNIEKLLH